mmetsp:Transcript_2974/g.6820  ORF Transcript_2974/g.6820 Transcript_2974/m.6820 type:complete len:471 (+) Transcript_2974:121-1533(+)
MAKINKQRPKPAAAMKSQAGAPADAAANENEPKTADLPAMKSAASTAMKSAASSTSMKSTAMKTVKKAPASMKSAAGSATTAMKSASASSSKQVASLPSMKMKSAKRLLDDDDEEDEDELDDENEDDLDGLFEDQEDDLIADEKGTGMPARPRSQSSLNKISALSAAASKLNGSHLNPLGTAGGSALGVGGPSSSSRGGPFLAGQQTNVGGPSSSSRQPPPLPRGGNMMPDDDEQMGQLYDPMDVDEELDDDAYFAAVEQQFASTGAPPNKKFGNQNYQLAGYGGGLNNQELAVAKGYNNGKANSQPPLVFPPWDATRHEDELRDNAKVFKDTRDLDPMTGIKRYRNQVQKIAGRNRLIETHNGMHNAKYVEKEIRALQNNIGQMLLSKASFRRVVRSAQAHLGWSERKWSTQALAVLQRVLEESMCLTCGNSLLLATHAKRVTLKAVDMETLHRLKENSRKEVKRRCEM